MEEKTQKLQNNTSFLTLFSFFLYVFTVRLGWPQIVGYMVVILVVANLALIGKLLFEIEQNKKEINLPKNRFSAIFRMIINLVLLLLLIFHLGLI